MRGNIGRRQKQVLKLLGENGAMRVSEIVKMINPYWRVCGFDYTRMDSLLRRGLVELTNDKVQTYDLA